MRLARGFVPLLLGIIFVVVSVRWVAFIIPAFVPALVLVAILLLVRGVRELRGPGQYLRH